MVIIIGLPSEAPLCVRRGALWVGTKERSKQVTDLYEESKDRFPTLQMLTRDQVGYYLHGLTPLTGILCRFLCSLAIPSYSYSYVHDTYMSLRQYRQ